MSEKEREFEITKHFASVLRCHFRWISCHTHSDGSAIAYCEKDGEITRHMTGDKVRAAGREIERHYKERRNAS